MIRPACLAAFARDIAKAAAFGTIVAAVADWATEAKHLRTLAAELTDANTRLRHERDRWMQHADRLTAHGQQLADMARMQADHIRELTTLEDDDDAEGYEPAAPVHGPAFIAEQVAEFRGQIEAWGGEVQ